MEKLTPNQQRLRAMSLKELEFLLTEPGHHCIQAYGWKWVGLELVRRIKEKVGSGGRNRTDV